MLSTRILRAAATAVHGSSASLAPLEPAIVHLPLTRWPATTTSIPETAPTSSTSTSTSVPLQAEESDLVELPAHVFHAPSRPDILHQCVVAHLASLRQGTAHTKNRAEVRGSNRKIMRQKGTGKARVGDANSPIRRGGGRAFPKRQRDFSLGLNSKVWKMGVRTALSERWRRGELTIIPSSPMLEQISTRSLARLLPLLSSSSNSSTSPTTTTTSGSQFDISSASTLTTSQNSTNPEKTLFLLSSLETNFALSARNLPNVTLELVDDIDVYPLLHGDRVVLDMQAVQQLANWLGPRRASSTSSTSARRDAAYTDEVDETSAGIADLTLQANDAIPGEGIHDNGTAGIAESLKDETDDSHSSSNPQILEQEEEPAISKRNPEDPLAGNPAKKGTDQNEEVAKDGGDRVREEMEDLARKGGNQVEDADRPNAKDILGQK